jgi:hypothetical protein
VDFVDNDNFILACKWRIFHIIAEHADIFDAIIRCAVDFGYVHRAAFGNRTADFAFVAGFEIVGGRIRAIDRFRENTGDRRLSAASLAREEIRMSEPSLADSIFQGACYVVLPDHIGEAHRAPLAGGYLESFGHAPTTQIDTVSVLR